MKTAPYGSWKSPITAAMLAEPPKFGGYGPGELIGDDVIAARSDPNDGGRVSLWRLPERTELTPGHYVRTALHEYGGGDWAATADSRGGAVIAYSDFPGGDLRILHGGSDDLLAPGGNYRYGGLKIDPTHGVVLAVREDTSAPGEPKDEIVSINIRDYLNPVLAASPSPVIAGLTRNPAIAGAPVIAGLTRNPAIAGAPVIAGLTRNPAIVDSPNPVTSPVIADSPDCVIADSPNPVIADSPDCVIAGLTRNPAERTTVLVSGADFYACPSLSQDGRLAWVQWNHPNMPWDTTTIMVAPLNNLADANKVSTGTDESAVYPSWAPDGSLIYLSDLQGFWNFYRFDGHQSKPLHQASYDFCGPMWVPEPSPYCIISADAKQVEIGCTWLQDGVSQLGVLRCDLATGTSELQQVPTDAIAANIRGSGTRSTLLLGYPNRRGTLATVDWNTQTISPLPLPTDPNQPDLTGYISVAQPIEWEGEYGPVHAWYYPPTNKDYQAPAGELPPVQVLSHGGPTSYSLPTYNLSDIQYWTSRGIGILDVNYSGSSGYGRAYRERLKGNWGIVDVEDCAAGALVLVERGLADPKRLSIKGGSAGGYTTLASLAFKDVFTAGISLYGIGDLEVLAKDTHKFESRYMDGLVGPYPERRDLYLERSPNHHLDKFDAAMLILQGSEDKVVPPQLAYAMADAIRAKGHPATLMVFDGEGHGFRRADTIIAATEAALNFLGETYNFTPSP